MNKFKMTFLLTSFAFFFGFKESNSQSKITKKKTKTEKVLEINDFESKNKRRFDLNKKEDGALMEKFQEKIQKKISPELYAGDGYEIEKQYFIYPVNYSNNKTYEVIFNSKFEIIRHREITNKEFNKKVPNGN